MLMTVMAMISTVPVLMTMFKLKGEEGKNRTEHILGRAVSRTQLLGSYFIISIVVGFVVLSLTAVGLWSADRKSTRLNSSHVAISYAVFCLKKKKKNNINLI